MKAVRFLTALVTNQPVEFFVVLLLGLLLLAYFTYGEVLFCFVSTRSGLADVATGELHSLLAVVVSDSPARLLVQTLQSAVVGCPGTVVGQICQVGVVIVGAKLHLGCPFRPGIVDEPVEVPRVVSRRIGCRNLLGEKRVHVEAVVLGRRKVVGFRGLINQPLQDGVFRCVDLHAVVIPVRHMSKS